MNKVFAKHEAEFIASFIKTSGSMTYEVSTPHGRTYAFSEIRFGCSTTRRRTDYLVEPPRQRESTEDRRHNHNWTLDEQFMKEWEERRLDEIDSKA